MNIGQAANEFRVSATMIRYYESIGVIAPAQRAHGDHPAYGRDAIQILRLIRGSLACPVTRQRANEVDRARSSCLEHFQGD
jgi:MerR family copper efflux transcriptional regulator